MGRSMAPPRERIVARRLKCEGPRRSRAGPLTALLGRAAYGRLLATLPKVFDSLPPSVGSTAAMATATRAAIRPYSIAVAPDSSCMKRETNLDIWNSLLAG